MDFDQFVSQIASRLRVRIPRPVHTSYGLFDDLGLDSFQTFELLIIVEGLADCMVPPMDTPELYTLGDAYDYYQQLRAAVLAES